LRESRAGIALMLARGNHDANAGDPPAAWRVEVVADASSRSVHLLPLPAAPRTGFALCGHGPPGVHVPGPAFDSARVSCVVPGSRHALLRAFGRLTGPARIAPNPGETCVAIAGSHLLVLQ